MNPDRGCRKDQLLTLRDRTDFHPRTAMLETVILVLFILWILGAFVTPIPAVGGLIHVLLAVILIVVVYRLLQGRRALN
jgi:Family of unknown function (DUF5670)